MYKPNTMHHDDILDLAEAAISEAKTMFHRGESMEVKGYDLSSRSMYRLGHSKACMAFAYFTAAGQHEVHADEAVKIVAACNAALQQLDAIDRIREQKLEGRPVKV